MSYNDGWRVYEDEPVKVEKVNMLYGLKASLEKQLEKQAKKVAEVSEKTRALDLYNSTPKRRSAANMRLSEECNYRDRLQRRINIVTNWIEEVKSSEVSV